MPLSSQIDNAEDAFENVADTLANAANQPGDPFTASDLDCIAGIETGRTWNPNTNSKNGQYLGMFQINAATWNGSGTGYAFNTTNADNPAIEAAVALAVLSQKLATVEGLNGIANGVAPTASQITAAIDRYGENNGHYGQAVVDCAKQMDAGNFTAAYQTLENYANWKNGN